MGGGEGSLEDPTPVGLAGDVIFPMQFASNSCIVLLLVCWHGSNSSEACTREGAAQDDGPLVTWPFVNLSRSLECL